MKLLKILETKANFCPLFWDLEHLNLISVTAKALGTGSLRSLAPLLFDAHLLLISCLFIRGYTKNLFASPYKTVWRPFFYNPSMLEKCWTYSSMWKAVTEWEASFLQGTSSATPQLSGVLRSQFLFSCGPQECGSHNDRNSTTNFFFSSHVKRFVESSLSKSPELHFAVLH